MAIAVDNAGVCSGGTGSFSFALGSGNSVVMDWNGSADDWATIGVAMAEAAAAPPAAELGVAIGIMVY